MGCTSCEKGVYLWNGMCKNVCPIGTYANITQCQLCSQNCIFCFGSANNCSSCSLDFYFIPGSFACVSFSDCPNGTYADRISRQCKQCSLECNTCNGPTNSNCLECNFAEGFGGLQTTGICTKVLCPKDSFVNINLTMRNVTCQLCHPTCATCNGFGPQSCLTCVQSLHPVQASNGFQCMTCKQISIGYTTDVQGNCQEICGDGKNLGQYQCDDGNKINGDGCSSTCFIEYGYKCTHGADLLDVCVNILLPTATLQLLKGLNLAILFSKPIIMQEKCKEILLTKFVAELITNGLTVRIENTYMPCDFKWYLNDKFAKGVQRTTLQISTNVSCNLKGDEYFVVIFKNRTLLKDGIGNSLTSNIIQCKASYFAYNSGISPGVVSTGMAFTITNAITFGIVLIFNSLQ